MWNGHFFIANRDLVSSRKPLFSKTIFREMRNKRLIPRETLFWLCLLLLYFRLLLLVINIAYPAQWQPTRFDPFAQVFRGTQFSFSACGKKNGGMVKCRTRQCFGHEVLNLFSFVSSCEKWPFFSVKRVKPILLSVNCEMVFLFYFPRNAIFTTSRTAV